MLHERIAEQSGGGIGVRDIDVDEQEQVVLAVAAGETSRAQLTDWLRNHLRALRSSLSKV